MCMMNPINLQGYQSDLKKNIFVCIVHFSRKVIWTKQIKYHATINRSPAERGETTLLVAKSIINENILHEKIS